MGEMLRDLYRFGIADTRVPIEIMMLLLVVGAIIFLWDLFDRQSKTLRKSSGLGENTEMIAVRGSNLLPSRKFVSDRLGLSSHPDALIREGKFIIPVDIKPTNKKVQDRHVVELLAHMKLIEEIEKQRPPFGILLMGAEQRQVKIQNLPEKQRWLDTLIDEMRSIMDGVPAVPSPSRFKCKRCDVREICEHSVYNDKKND